MQMARFRGGEPNCAPQLSDPVHLTAFASVPSNSSTGVNAAALKNPVGAAMMINQIKFSLKAQVNAGAQFQATVLGGMILCELKLGNIPLTNGFIPVWNFVKPNSLNAELFTVVTEESVADAAYAEFCWTLPRPLYVPANAVIIPTFSNTGLVPNTIDVRISYAGRSLKAGAPTPKKVAIPYVSSYISKNFPADDEDSDESSELSLINPFDQPLKLQRLTGRCQNVRNINGSAIVYADEGFSQILTAGAGDHYLSMATPGEEMISVKIYDSNGRPIVKDFTIFRSVFPTATRSWELDNGAVMDPQSYYRVFVDKQPALIGDTADDFTIFSQLTIGAVGWREISDLGEIA